MSAVETQAGELAKIHAKLSAARAELKTSTDELNVLRNRVAELEDKSPVEDLRAQVSELATELAAAKRDLKVVGDELAKAQRDLVAAGPAIALAAAVKSI